MNNFLCLETMDTEDQELRVRTPPKQHSPERLAFNEEYELLYEFLSTLKIKDEFSKFFKHEVTFYDLWDLNQEDLAEMNILPDLIPKLLKSIKNLKFSKETSIPKGKKVLDMKNLIQIQAHLKNIEKGLDDITQKIYSQQLEIINLYESQIF